MARRQLRGILLACCAGGALLTVASESQGCYFFERLFGCAPAPTYYAPPACAPAPCNPCAQPVCGTPMCAPQATYYQPMYRPAPVMAMMPVAAASPCSPCAVTSYRPVRAWTYQANLMPYTSYRVTYSNPCPTTYLSCGPSASCATGGCSTGGCATGGCATTYYSGSACGGCETSSSPMPSPSDMSQPPANSQPSGQTPTYAPEQPGSGTPAPAPAPSNNGLPQPKLNSSTTMLYPNTLRDHRPAALPLQQPVIQNVPPIGGPQLTPTPPVRPGVEDRRASRTTHQAVHFDLIPSPPQPMPVHPAVYDRPASVLPPGMDRRQVNDGGWQGVE